MDRCESLYHKTLDHMLEGCQIIGFDWHYLYMNDAACRHGRQSRENLLGKTMMEAYPGIEDSELFALLEDCMKERHFHQIENEFNFPDGSSGWFELSIQPVPEGMFILSIEITERKTAELELRQREEQFRTLFEQAPIGIDLVSPDGKPFIVNRALQQMLGYSEEYMQDRPMSDWTHPDDTEKSWQLIDRLKTGKADYLSVEKRYICKDGRLVWGRTAVVPVRDEGGEVKYFIAMVEDITDQVQAEEALAASEKKYRTIFESASEGILVADAVSRKFYFANPAVCRMLGYSLEELLELDVSKLHTHERLPQVVEIFDSQVRGGKPLALNLPFLRKDGTIVYADVNTALIEMDGRSCLVGFLTDVSGRKRLEDENRILENQFRHSQKMESLGRLAGGVAHDYNNMLSVILGYADLTLAGLQQEDLRNNLDQIIAAGERARDITHQLLAFARQEGNNPKVINLNQTVEEMIKMLKRLLGEDIELSWHGDPDLWQLKIDPTHIDQIMTNLCVNARDAIENVGRLTIETHNIKVDEGYCRKHTTFSSGDYVMLLISDDGCGMDQVTQEKIFDPFFSTKEQGKGTGLGLSTVFGIVKQNQGFINLYSEPGQGTTFRLYFPRYDGSPVEDAIDMVPSDISAKNEMVLVVEDNKAILDLICNMLVDSGYRVIAAGNPAEALALVDQYGDDIQLLLTDVIMPGMNGRELAARVETLIPNIKLLYMSGYPSDAVISRGGVGDDYDYITKPFSKRDLGIKLRKALEPNAAV